MLERPGHKAKRVGHGSVLDERRVGRSPPIIPTADRSVRYRSSAGLEGMLRSLNSCDPQPDGLLRKSPRIMSCHTPRTQSKMPNSLWMNCSGESIELPSGRRIRIGGRAITEVV